MRPPSPPESWKAANYHDRLWRLKPAEDVRGNHRPGIPQFVGDIDDEALQCEGLDEIIVGARVQSLDAVGDVPRRAEDDRRWRGTGLGRGDQRKAVSVQAVGRDLKSRRLTFNNGYRDRREWEGS